jgi:hypothetical protein
MCFGARSAESGSKSFSLARYRFHQQESCDGYATVGSSQVERDWQANDDLVRMFEGVSA